MGTAIRKGEGGHELSRELYGRQIFTSVSSGWLWAKVRGPLCLGRITTEDLKLTSFLAAQRKSELNFPYFRLGIY